MSEDWLMQAYCFQSAKYNNFELLLIDLYYALVKLGDSCCGKDMMAVLTSYISYITWVCLEQGLMGIPLYPVLLS